MLTAAFVLGSLPLPVVATRAPAEPEYVPSRAAQETGDCTADWRLVSLPRSAFKATLFDIVTRARRPAWLLGGSKRGLVALKWRDGTWVDVGIRKAGFRGLNDGLAGSAGTLLGVGYLRPGSSASALTPLAGHAGGSTWAQEAVAAVPGIAILTGVSGAGGPTWAVGRRVSNGRSSAIAFRRVKRAWRRADSPAVARDSGLMSVARAPNKTIWAVGWKAAGGTPRPLLLRRSASRWVRARAPRLPAGTAILTDVTFRTTRDGWASGYIQRRGTSSYRPLLLHWNGDRWRREALPWGDASSAVLRSVAVHADGRLWLAGAYLAEEEREARGFVAERDAGGWSVRELATPPAVRSEVHVVASTRKGAMAAGTVGGTSVVLETCVGITASARGRIKVGDMRARRAVAEGEDDESVQAAAVGDRSAAALPSLAARVAPRGFRMRDVTSEAGIEAISRTYGGLAADFDGNGWTDIFYSRHGGLTPRLYLGGPEGFALANDSAFSIKDRHGCDSADVDADGSLDIFCSVGRSQGTTLHRHELSLAPAAGHARLARSALGAADPFGRGRRAVFIHLDGDEYPELFVTTAPDRVDGLPGSNRFFRNVEGRFVAAPHVGLDRNVGGRCAVAADIDADGDEDLLLCASYPGDGRPPGLRIFRNEGGRLHERSAALGVKPLRDRDVLVTDMTGDGRPDLVQLGDGRLRVSRGTRDGFVTRFEVRLRHGVALAAGDVDGDGFPDLYVVTAGPNNARDHLLVNRRRARAFDSVRMPQAASGRGDDVMALDHDHNGLADFLVLNGLPRAGPIQLLASYRRP